MATRTVAFALLACVLCVFASEDTGLVVFWAADGIHEIFMNSSVSDPTKTGQRVILKWPRGDDHANLWPPVIGGLCADAAHGIVAWTENRHIGGRNLRRVYMAELDGTSTEPMLLADLGSEEGDLSQGCVINPAKFTLYFCEFIKKIHKQRITEITFKGKHGAWKIDGKPYYGRTMAVQETHPQGGGVLLRNGEPYMTASKVTSSNPAGVPGLFRETTKTFEDVRSTLSFGGWKGHLGYPVLQPDGSVLIADSDSSKIPSEDRKGAVYKVASDMTSSLFTPYRGSLPISPHVGDDSAPGEINSIALQPTLSATSQVDDILFLQGEPPSAIYEAAFKGATKRFDYRTVFQTTEDEEIGEYGIGPIVWVEDFVHTPSPPEVKCTGFTCSMGFKDKMGNKDDLVCPGGTCTDEVCCDAIEEACKDFTCPTNYKDAADKATKKCGDKPCDKFTCCDSSSAFVMCTDYTCPSGYTDKPNKKDVMCGPDDSYCSAVKCCVDGSVAATPTPGSSGDTPTPGAATPTPPASGGTPVPPQTTPTPPTAGATTPIPGDGRTLVPLGAALQGSDDGLPDGIVILLCSLVGALCLLVGAIIAWYVVYKAGKEKRRKANENNTLFGDTAKGEENATLSSTMERRSAPAFAPIGERNHTADSVPFAPIDRMYSTRTDPSLVQTCDLNVTMLRAPAGDVRGAANIEVMEMTPIHGEGGNANRTSLFSIPSSGSPVHAGHRHDSFHRHNGSVGPGTGRTSPPHHSPRTNRRRVTQVASLNSGQLRNASSSPNGYPRLY